MTMLALRQQLSDVASRALFRGERFVITNYGKEYGAWIGPEDLALLRSASREAGDDAESKDRAEGIAA